MAVDGYKAENSHEAIIAFINEYYKRDFGEKLVIDFDRYRVMRHNSVYRVTAISPEETKKALAAAKDFSRIASGLVQVKLLKI